jgi:hypothetical protein
MDHEDHVQRRESRTLRAEFAKTVSDRVVIIYAMILASAAPQPSGSKTGNPAFK